MARPQTAAMHRQVPPLQFRLSLDPMHSGLRAPERYERLCRDLRQMHGRLSPLDGWLLM